MTPAYPTGVERAILRAIRQRQQSDAGPERWAQLDDLQAATFAALLASHTAEQWTAATGRLVSAPQLATQRQAAAAAIRSVLAQARDLTRAPTLLARDLVVSARQSLTVEAAQRTGVFRFRWRTRRDERVRPEHRALEGQVFDLATGAPGIGRPGEPWGCRCSAEPVP